MSCGSLVAKIRTRWTTLTWLKRILVSLFVVVFLVFVWKAILAHDKSGHSHRVSSPWWITTPWSISIHQEVSEYDRQIVHVACPQPPCQDLDMSWLAHQLNGRVLGGISYLQVDAPVISSDLSPRMFVNFDIDTVVLNPVRFVLSCFECLVLGNHQPSRDIQAPRDCDGAVQTLTLGFVPHESCSR